MKREDTILYVLAGLLFVVGGGAAVVVLANWKGSANAKKYIPALNVAEDRYGIPRDLLARQAYQESRFRTDIITGATRSGAGAVGLMQIVPKWHPSLDKGDAAADERAALDPNRAIDYAARYMRDLHKQFGSWKLALAAYNAGPGNVKKYGGIPPFKETQNYVSQIIGDLVAPGDLNAQARYA